MMTKTKSDAGLRHIWTVPKSSLTLNELKDLLLLLSNLIWIQFTLRITFYFFFQKKFMWSLDVVKCIQFFIFSFLQTPHLVWIQCVSSLPSPLVFISWSSFLFFFSPPLRYGIKRIRLFSPPILWSSHFCIHYYEDSSQPLLLLSSFCHQMIIVFRTEVVVAVKR